MKKEKNFYITTPIYYPSSSLHIGHAYTTVAADAFARFERLTGHDVWFLTGSDEHGQKIERSAREKGKSPQEYVDQIVEGFKTLWEKLLISNDDFIRTTEERHKKAVQAVFQKLYDQGDIYKASYKGWYCTPCEAMWTEARLEEGMCPDCARPVEAVEEESFFFRMSDYAGRLLDYIEANPEFIQPTSRRNEMVSFINSGLEDLCVSRTTFKWGIPVPFDSAHIIYVWVDALTNYISALGYASGDDTLYKKFWPADIHLVGKDIVRFHSIIWPILLMSMGIELPRQVMGHGWLLLESGKMSKSLGNVVDPLELIDKYGVDAVRYYLLREVTLGVDVYYSEQALVKRINMDLANDLGNLVSRTLGMVQKYLGGEAGIPGQPEGIDLELIGLAMDLPPTVRELMDKRDLSGALSAIWKLVGRANKYVDETQPWSLNKEPAHKERLTTVLYNMLECLRFIGVLVTPFMPLTPSRIWSQLNIQDQKDLHTWDSLTWGRLPAGLTVRREQALFPRIEV